MGSRARPTQADGAWTIALRAMKIQTNMFLFLFVLSGHILDLCVHSISIERLPRKKYQEIGDLNLGILVPVHKFSKEGFCSQAVRELGVLQRIEAIAEVKCFTVLLSFLQMNGAKKVQLWEK